MSSKLEHQSRLAAAGLMSLASLAGGLTLSVLSGGRSRGHVATLRKAAHALDHTGMFARLPVVTPQELGLGHAEITLAETAAERWNVTVAELVVLSELVRLRKPRMLFEFGTFDGRTTLNLLANAPDDAEIITLDLPRETNPAGHQAVVGHRLHVRAALLPRVHQVLADSRSLDISAWQGQCDFVFVDADHSYAAVLQDSDTAFRLAAPGAIILWHDYVNHLPVTRALDELRAKDRRFGDLRRVAETSLVVLTT